MRSRFRWQSADPLRGFSAYSNGQLEFLTVGDLTKLGQIQPKLDQRRGGVGVAMGDRIATARKELSQSGVAEALELDVRVCDYWAHLASITDRPLHGSSEARRVLSKPLAWQNPLMQAWELKQVLRLWDAADAICEDAICDLCEELLPSRPESVLRAALAMSPYESSLRDRIVTAQTKRGEPGDPRRIHRQFPRLTSTLA